MCSSPGRDVGGEYFKPPVPHLGGRGALIKPGKCLRELIETVCGEIIALLGKFGGWSNGSPAGEHLRELGKGLRRDPVALEVTPSQNNFSWMSWSERAGAGAEEGPVSRVPCAGKGNER